MARFILSAQARLDYFEAFDFISGYSSSAASIWEAGMLEAFQHLSAWPRTGRIRPEYAPSDLRFWVVDDHLILYNPSADPVELVAILHGAQNLTDLIATRLTDPTSPEDDD